MANILYGGKNNMKIQLTKNKEVYNSCRPYIIAEIGANHNGDMSLAKKMIDAAVNCGCDAVKFQSWTKSSLISKSEYKANTKYTDSKKKHFGSLEEMVDAYYLRTEQHYELRDYCKLKGIDFNSTPFDFKEVDLLNDLGVVLPVPSFAVIVKLCVTVAEVTVSLTFGVPVIAPAELKAVPDGNAPEVTE